MTTYSLGAAIFVIRDDAILLTYRIRGQQQGAWEIPAGHIEGSETAEEAAVRELFEETTLTAHSLKSMGTYVNHTFCYKAAMFLAETSGEASNVDERNHSLLLWQPLARLPRELGATTRHGLNILGLLSDDPS